MKLSELKKNELNPRKITDKKKALLKKSVEKFGDLGGIIYNVQTKRLVGGHQRSSILPEASTIKKENLKKKSPTGTVAYGYIIIDDEKYSYREVDWDKKTEVEAMIAANKHSGSWDRDVLKLAISEIDDLEITGFDMDELGAMGISFDVPVVEVETPQIQTEQKKETDKDEDEVYLKENPGPDSEMNKENIDMVNRDVYENTDESLESKLQKEMINIVCESKEIKEDVKKRLREQGFNDIQGAKIF